MPKRFILQLLGGQVLIFELFELFYGIDELLPEVKWRF